jgi:hypothetical protein
VNGNQQTDFRLVLYVRDEEGSQAAYTFRPITKRLVYGAAGLSRRSRQCFLVCATFSGWKYGNIGEFLEAQLSAELGRLGKRCGTKVYEVGKCYARYRKVRIMGSLDFC